MCSRVYERARERSLPAMWVKQRHSLKLILYSLSDKIALIRGRSWRKRKEGKAKEKRRKKERRSVFLRRAGLHGQQLPQRCLTSKLYTVIAPVTSVESSPPHVLPERRSKNVTAAPKYRKAATVRCISWRCRDKRRQPPPTRSNDTTEVYSSGFFPGLGLLLYFAGSHDGISRRISLSLSRINYH